MCSMLIIAALFAVYHQTVKPLVSAQTCSYESGNLQGKVAYLNLYNYYSGYEYIDTPEECCQACYEMSASCNSWTYCDDPNGCGTGCKVYVDEWGAAWDREDWDWIQTYAPVAFNEESLERDSQCGDKWPYKTCSLKVSDHSYDFIQDGPAAAGWVSGHTGWKDKSTFACMYNKPARCCAPIILDIYQCPDDSCGARSSNIQAELITLDVNALDINTNSFRGYGGMNGSTPAECCQFCQNDQDCGFWVFCAAEEGCGSNCQEFVDEVNSNSDAQPLYGICNNADKYRYRMCSLKKKGEYVELTGDDQAGWISGIGA
eukprot:TRINITY_DN900_c0_g1_i1.p1 TRINITY_DN900_c0_g1~~TRINITY_DN900_c0_g1_i1.p1  ORF type:complete len:316 (-),score=25.97 TRINITY_DN900_c0_g1_i1:853-1800(-)